MESEICDETEAVFAEQPKARVKGEFGKPFMVRPG